MCVNIVMMELTCIIYVNSRAINYHLRVESQTTEIERGAEKTNNYVTPKSAVSVYTVEILGEKTIKI